MKNEKLGEEDGRYDTERHLQNAVEQRLLKNQFEAICIIDTEKSEYRVRFMNDDNENNGKILDDYEDGCRRSADKYIVPEERALFMQKASIEWILTGLKTNEKYSFIVNGLDQQGKRQMYQYSYFYLDEKRMVLAALSDVTKFTNHDVLTGEFNRYGFNAYVSEFLENCEDRTKYAILFFNIKGFKAINDLLGVEGGDEILRESVDILRNSFLKPIAIGRLEADHFVLFVKKKNIDYDRISEICKRSYKDKKKTIKFYGRCGIYILNNMKHDVDGMCDRARMAKQFIQDDYVKPYAVYDQRMRKDFTKKRDLLNELEKGVNNEEFAVYYQPIYDAVSGKIVSAEALIRWIHPEYGIISPNEFIPVFEENGHISQLDMFVENSAKNFIVDRLSQKKPMVPLAINLSRMDFYDTEFMAKILKDVEEIKELDSFCRLEITESAYSALIDQAVSYIRRFKEVGVKILLDDFGSGYSSFSTIQQFDFDILKLDMGFVQNIGKSKKVENIIKNVIHMAHDLNLEVVSEGVETEVQKEFLMKQNCDYIQGYYFSKPLPEDKFIQLLDSFEK